MFELTLALTAVSDYRLLSGRLSQILIAMILVFILTESVHCVNSTSRRNMNSRTV